MSEPATFPLTLGQLNYSHELPPEKGKRWAVYKCTCGTELKKELYNARASKMRSSFSACGKCRARNNRKGRGVRFAAW